MRDSARRWERKRAVWLVGACLSGGLLILAVVSGVRASAQAVTVVGPRVAAPSRGPTAAPREVVINEVAWMGTAADYSDEWIELYNNTDQDIDLAGWSLAAADGTPNIPLSGVIPAHGYFLLERSDDSTVSDIPADLIYTGALENDPNAESLTLYDGIGQVVDTANGDGGTWPAGNNSTKHTMERVDPTAPGTDANWAANDGVTRNGLDADGNPINGTPKARNSCYQPPVGPGADLVVAKTGPLTAAPGGLITYHIALSNVGSRVATAVRVADALPAAVGFVTQTSPFTFTLSQPGSALVWEAGDVTTGAVRLITVTGRVTGTACGALTNRVTATTTASETVTANNVDDWTTTVGAAGGSPVLVSAVLYDGYQANDPDEAVQLVNVGIAPADLSGWCLDDDTSGTSCAIFASGTLLPGQRIWVASRATSFTLSFGFPPDYEAEDTDPGVPDLSGSWPGYSNTGDEVVLRNDLGNVADAVVYEDGNTDIIGWSGPAVQPYPLGRAEGQILYRVPDEDTGLPASDTDTAADWIQHTGDIIHGRRVLYPGWDLDPLFWPLTATEQATIIVGITPDNGFDVLSQTIARAQRTISIEVYALRHPEIITALVQKAREGVHVTLLLEGQQAGVGDSDPQWQQELWACQQIEAAGGQCYFSIHETDERIFNRYDYLHAKFLIVDDEWMLITPQNLSASSLPSDDKSNGTYGSRGVVLATNAPSVAAHAARVFALDLDPVHHNDILRWGTAYAQAHGYGPPDPAYTPVLTTPDHVTCTVRFPNPLTATGFFGFELFTAPEAALRQSDALLGLLARAGAGDTVYVEQLYEQVAWGDNPNDDPNPRLEAYIAAARRGATVRILLNCGTFDQPFYQSTNTSTVAYVNQIARAEALDLAAALGDPTQWGIHNKMVLVWLHDEGGTAHVGSINGSEASSKVNREMALQVRSDEIYHHLAQMFEADWWLAHPVFLPLAMRGHTPPPPPVDHVVISEVMVRPHLGDPPGNREWVELYNPTDRPIDISGWSLGDAAAPGEYGSGTYLFPTGTVLPTQGVIVVAQQAADLAFTPDFEIALDPGRDNPAVPNMMPAGTWDGFGLALGNAGDEVILRSEVGADVDVVVWDDPTDDPVVSGNYPGVLPWRGLMETDWSLERRPPYYDTDDCGADFFSRYPATPGSVPAP